MCYGIIYLIVMLYHIVILMAIDLFAVKLKNEAGLIFT